MLSIVYNPNRYPRASKSIARLGTTTTILAEIVALPDASVSPSSSSDSRCSRRASVNTFSAVYDARSSSPCGCRRGANLTTFLHGGRGVLINYLGGSRARCLSPALPLNPAIAPSPHRPTDRPPDRPTDRWEQLIFSSIC